MQKCDLKAKLLEWFELMGYFQPGEDRLTKENLAGFTVTPDQRRLWTEIVSRVAPKQGIKVSRKKILLSRHLSKEGTLGKAQVLLSVYHETHLHKHLELWEEKQNSTKLMKEKEEERKKLFQNIDLKIVDINILAEKLVLMKTEEKKNEDDLLRLLSFNVALAANLNFHQNLLNHFNELFKNQDCQLESSEWKIQLKEELSNCQCFSKEDCEHSKFFQNTSKNKPPDVLLSLLLANNRDLLNHCQDTLNDSIKLSENRASNCIRDILNNLYKKISSQSLAVIKNNTKFIKHVNPKKKNVYDLNYSDSFSDFVHNIHENDSCDIEYKSRLKCNFEIEATKLKTTVEKNTHWKQQEEDLENKFAETQLAYITSEKEKENLLTILDMYGQCEIIQKYESTKRKFEEQTAQKNITDICTNSKLSKKLHEDFILNTENIVVSDTERQAFKWQNLKLFSNLKLSLFMSNSEILDHVKAEININKTLKEKMNELEGYLSNWNKKLDHLKETAECNLSNLKENQPLEEKIAESAMVKVRQAKNLLKRAEEVQGVMDKWYYQPYRSMVPASIKLEGESLQEWERKRST